MIQAYQRSPIQRVKNVDFVSCDKDDDVAEGNLGLIQKDTQTLQH